MPRSFYRRTDIVILTFDITNQKSFDNVKVWMKAVKVGFYAELK